MDSPLRAAVAGRATAAAWAPRDITFFARRCRARGDSLRSKRGSGTKRPREACVTKNNRGPMPAFVRRSLVLVGFAVLHSSHMRAQPVEEPEEIIVRGKPLSEFRLEIERAHDEMVRLFNDANEDDDTDVRCRDEAPTGSRIPRRVCFSVAQERASASAALDFLRAGTRSTGSSGRGAAGMARRRTRQAKRAVPWSNSKQNGDAS